MGFGHTSTLLASNGILWFLCPFATLFPTATLVSPAAADDVSGYRVHLRGTLAFPETAPDERGNAVRLTGASGVTWLGADRYVAVLDNSRWLVRFRLTLSRDGVPRTIDDIRLVGLREPHDYEDIAPCPDVLRRRIVERRLRKGMDEPGPCLLVCEESTPAIRAVALDSGDLLGVVPIPEPLGTPRPNRGLEALAVDADGEQVWTANEEALPADGPPATAGAGTVVRLVRIAIPAGDRGPRDETRQFAYPVDPPHAFVRVLPGEPLSGVSALVSLGANKLLVLERSGGPGLPPFENRIQLVDCSTAADVSGIDHDLAGRGDQMLAKRLLWKESLGCNVEGLCLGPALTEGGHALVAISDNGGLGTPTQIVGFALDRPPGPRLTSP